MIAADIILRVGTVRHNTGIGLRYIEILTYAFLLTGSSNSGTGVEHQLLKTQ